MKLIWEQLNSCASVLYMTGASEACVCLGVLQVGNLGLLFMLLFFIYAALGVELFGELGKCTFIQL